jgi:hypothetical protein
MDPAKDIKFSIEVKTLNSSNSQFELFSVTSGRQKPFEERRNPLLGVLAAASLLPTSSKSVSQPFFPSN